MGQAYAPRSSDRRIPGCTGARDPRPIDAAGAREDAGVVLAVLAAIVNLDHSTTVFKVGWFEITLANLVVFGLLAVVFALGLLIQLPGRTGRDDG
jgi:NhaP-type Na+/H+ and K+/H+ antiporter